MRLLAELCRVVDDREDPGPWARRAVASAADALKRSSRLKTWHVERAVYVSVLLGAVWAQHHETLGTPSSPASGLLAAIGVSPEVAALATVVVLGVALLRAVDSAEFDSIGTREREQAEAEGREPVKVECSPRAAQLRARGPWMDLALLAFAFGWVGAVGFAWRLGYPLWRKAWRKRYPPACKVSAMKTHDRSAIRRWMLMYLVEHRDASGEVNLTALVEAWDHDQDSGEATLDEHHPAWDVAVEVAEQLDAEDEDETGGRP